MQECYPVYNHQVIKNKPATASLIISIISMSFLVLVIPSLIVGGILVSMAGQSPQASGVDLNDPHAMEEFNRDSGNLVTTGIIFFIIPPILSGVTAIPGLILGISGVRRPHKRGQAIAGIVMSGIPVCIGLVILLFVLLS